MHLGDCLDQLKTLDENSVDSIVTDPPYGLSFMGKKWDYDVPSIDIWKECLRVLKPGGHVLSFGGTRTYHRMVVNIEDAGFQIRDQIQWIYGSGFPKSHNIKEGEFKGWGTALKPANEPICLARKPLDHKLTVAANVLKHGTGALNIDASRIGYSDEADKASAVPGSFNFKEGQKTSMISGTTLAKLKDSWTQPGGRWPANVLFDESAAAMLDEQSGPSKSNFRKAKANGVSSLFGAGESSPTTSPNDSGGASRFFYVAKSSKRERNAGLEGMPLHNPPQEYNLKAVDGNPRKPAACTAQEPVANHHPTVKPIKLMEYLITLVTPPNGVVLDPFMGSGTTGVASKNLGFQFVGIERDENYFEIAQKRVGA